MTAEEAAAFLQQIAKDVKPETGLKLEVIAGLIRAQELALQTYRNQKP